ncbi:MAG TPA: GNAT family N-acetyltransferase [Chitinophagales bacterium]|nr:GNAT family N-acetyltransferase [Chitinophagales bacterium]
MQTPKIILKQGSISLLMCLMNQIPEFDFYPHKPKFNEEYITQTLKGKSYLLLIAWVNDEPAGFKLGYRRWGKLTLYSWLGGVLPQYRRLGIAKLLANEQEAWARTKGYKRIIFKSRNRFTNMLLFALNNGFNFIKVEKADMLADYRLYLQKSL